MCEDHEHKRMFQHERSRMLAAIGRSYLILLPQSLSLPLSTRTIHTQDYQSVYLWRQSGAEGWLSRGRFLLMLIVYAAIASAQRVLLFCHGYLCRWDLKS